MTGCSVSSQRSAKKLSNESYSKEKCISTIKIVFFLIGLCGFLHTYYIMTFLWRRSRGGARGGAGKASKAMMMMKQEMVELTIPAHFLCPISLDLMKDPVTLSTGMTYDRESIEKWMEYGNITCPVTNQVLRNPDQIPNHSIREMIQDWCVENKARGVERIPTPRIPITPYEVYEIQSRMEAATRCGDAKTLCELVGKINKLAKESERNRRCIHGNGIGSVLADAFMSFAGVSEDAYVDLLKEILCSLTWAFPLGQEGISKLASDVSLRCLAWFLKSEDDLSARQNAICVLKELVCADEQGCIEGLMEIEGIEGTLVNFVRVPICPKATKASLVVIHHMVSSSVEKTGTENCILRFVEMGIITCILDILVDGDKSVCEKALGVLDSMLSWEEGRRSAYQNALTVPLLVKKILRVSDAATEFCISSLWKLNLGQNKDVLVEAVQLGVFQKLLLVLQIGCSEGAKEKVKDLLKVMNLYRGKLDCFESSMRFKYIKRSD